MDFYNQDNYSIRDIESLIKNEVEESVHLDYKEARALAKTDKARLDITKDVSSFANSDGGIIVYGISEIDNKPQKISPIDGRTCTKEWLENVIHSIQPRIDDIKIYPIRIENDIDKSIYVVKIPRSDDAPHMAKDYRYYKRYNFQSVPMEDYEIKDLYNRISTPKLEINRCGFYKVDEGKKDVTYHLVATVRNIGKKVCESYKLNFYINNAECCTVSHQTQDVRNLYTMMGAGRLKLSINSKAPIYPEEQLDLGLFRIIVPKQYNELFLNYLIVQMILFHTGGKEEIAYIPVKNKFVEDSETILNLIQMNRFMINQELR